MNILALSRVFPPLGENKPTLDRLGNDKSTLIKLVFYMKKRS